MMSSWKGTAAVAALVVVGAGAGLYALQSRQTSEVPTTALESGGVTVYKTPT